MVPDTSRRKQLPNFETAVDAPDRCITLCVASAARAYLPASCTFLHHCDAACRHSHDYRITENFLDPRIYQAAGQVVLAGINPYDFSDNPSLREKLRMDMAAPGTEGFTETQEQWNYYVSGNPPASTALYALFEALAHGSRVVWRLLLIAGDVSLFLGVFALLKTLRGRVDGALDQAGCFCLTVINPILILAGCAIPEDKQFQTALVLFSAAWLLSPAAATTRRAVGTGIFLSLSVFFKVFGVFLAPLWAHTRGARGMALCAADRCGRPDSGRPLAHRLRHSFHRYVGSTRRPG